MNPPAQHSPRLQLAMLSRRGSRERNEDACGHWGRGVPGQEGPACCVLADGAGGHGGGDVASQTAVTAVLESFAARPACDPARVLELIAHANRAVVTGQQASDARVLTVIFSAIAGGMLLTLLVAWLVFF